MKGFLLFLLTLALLMLFSCANNDSLIAFASWSNDSSAPSLMIDSNNSTNRAIVSRTLSSSDFPESAQTISNYYSSLGNLIDSYTPSSFKIPLVNVVLLSAESSEMIYSPYTDIPEEEDIYADFTSGISSTDFKEIPQGIYNGFLIVIDPMNSVVAGGGTAENPDWSFQEIHEIDVTIPDYTESNFNVTDSVVGFPERKYMGDNVFRFSFYELHPSPLKTPGANYLFTDKISDTAVVLGNNDGNEAEFNLASVIPNSTNPHFDWEVDVAFLSPSEVINLTAAVSLEIRVNLDLNNMIEVYDNNTEGDLSDDIVVFANNFWERFTLTYIFE